MRCGRKSLQIALSVLNVDPQLLWVQRLSLGKRGSRLVEDEHPSIQAERLRHLHELLGTEGQRPQALGGIHLEADALQDLERSLAHGPAIEEAAPVRLAPEEDVLLHGEVVAEAQLLMDEADPGSHGLAGSRETGGRSTQQDLPAVGGVDPRQDPHQGALASAVLTHDGQDLARANLQGDAPQRLHAAKRLVQTAALEHDAGGG